MYYQTNKEYFYYKLAVWINSEIGMFAFSYEGVSQLRFSVNYQSHRGTLSTTKGLLLHKKDVIQY
jgi:hypothetical protein